MINPKPLLLSFALALSLTVLGHPALAQSLSAKPQVFFISPQDGATVSNPVVVRFGLKNMQLAPAGENKPGTGHHHLLVDAPLPPLDEPIPNDANHLHFGKGQSETELHLAPGKHTLQLLMGDWTHIPHQPPVYSPPITIMVK
ncbi:MAG: DUF4399 domain-containing protein [Alphaproteobacteria bacterium]|nr:DUF4399 domain-containing protein [Alphaproteobacteria bacterium]